MDGKPNLSCLVWLTLCCHDSSICYDDTALCYEDTLSLYGIIFII